MNIAIATKSAESARLLRRPVSLVAVELRDHRGFVLVVTVFCLAAALAKALIAPTGGLGLTINFGLFGLVASVYLIICSIAYTVFVLIFIRPRRPFRYLWDRCQTRFFTARRLIRGGLVLAFLMPFTSAFSQLKSLIPAVQPFYLDTWLMHLDRWLHGGTDPWLLMQPVLGEPVVTFAFNVLYNLWFFVLYGLVFWQAFRCRDETLRMQFLLTLLFLWIVLGVLAATALSSAGPAFYGRTTGLDDPYAPLLDYLASANESYPIWSLIAQDILWQGYQNDTLVAGGGISAMPSLHVATSMVFAILGWRTHRLLGLALTLFLIAILIGSVHLGWHYAVDGYISLVAAPAMWWLVGRCLRAHARRRVLRPGTGRFVRGEQH